MRNSPLWWKELSHRCAVPAAMSRARRRIAACWLFLAVVAVSPRASASDAGPFIKLPVGTTRLDELGFYGIGYQIYGGKPVQMPWGWSGTFTEDVGIAYYEAGVQNGRRAHVLHCPWKGGTGSAVLVYYLDLPKAKPITLQFGIAMRADAIGKSDGATFSVLAGTGEKPIELMREHYARSEWKDFRIDLSRFAGEWLALIFQTEPGPQKDASFDFSLIAEPRVTVVRDEDPRPGLLRELLSSPAYKRAAARDLTTLEKDPLSGIAPSASADLRAEANLSGTEFSFSYRDEGFALSYRHNLRRALSNMEVRLDRERDMGVAPCQGAGVQFAPDRANPHVFRDPERSEVLSQKIGNGIVTAVCRYSLGQLSADVTWTFRLAGKSLAITADSASQDIGRLSLGHPLAVASRKAIRIPYLGLGQAYFFRPQNLYVMSYLDWHESMASRCSGNEAIYLPRLDGQRNPLHEVGYVAVSPNFHEVLPNLPHEPSPYLKLLAPKMVLDLWGGTFDAGAKLLRELKSYGVDHAAVIWHDWQCHGYDVKLPDHLPANPRLGGDEAMKRLADAARDAGYLFSLHENFIDFYPDAPSYDPKDVVLNPEGEFSKAWYHSGTKVQSFALKPTRMLHYAAQNSPEIHRRFGTTAAYLDVHTCVPPWHHVDFAPTADLGAAFRTNERAYHKLFQYERDTHKGPLLGEGANHFYWAGLADGVEAQVEGGEGSQLLLDFDLLRIHPQMVNHGMGYYSRWLRTGEQTKWGVDAPTPAQMDHYRAMEIAFGHAGFVGSPIVSTPYFVWREHNLVTPVQALYAAAKPTSILYEVDGRLVTASAAIPCGTLDRARVAYDSGLVVHANLRSEDWPVDGHILPQYGFLAKGPNLLAYTARRGGTIVDYAENAETLFADARTHGHRPWLDCRAIEPKLKGLNDLGDGLFEITYEWRVEEALDKDYVAFVHFTAPGADDGPDIRFQDDHAPSPATSKWEKGTVVVDGPHRVRIPPDEAAASYGITVGLYQRDAGRLPLRGVGAGHCRYLVGRLGVEREGGRVKKIELQPIEEERQKQLAQRRAFEERMNTGARMVDFGPVRTDGSFRLDKRQGGLTLLPYPREKAFPIELDLARLLPGTKAPAARIEAFDAEGRALGPVPSAANGTWLNFRAGAARAARFEIAVP